MLAARSSNVSLIKIGKLFLMSRISRLIDEKTLNIHLNSQPQYFRNLTKKEKIIILIVEVSRHWYVRSI